ncbi:MAG: EAL domain-containing protein, partial [Trueperaceae bacterium]|nr:EAL domain-containing protein [Trueperaceae bacterium]
MSHARTVTTGDDATKSPVRSRPQRALVLHDPGAATDAPLNALRVAAPLLVAMRVDTLPGLEAALRGRDWDLVLILGRLELLGFDDVMAQLRLHDDALPVVVAVGDAESDDDAFVFRAASAGAFDVVDPGDAGALAATITTLLHPAEGIGDEGAGDEGGASPALVVLAGIAAELSRCVTDVEAYEKTVRHFGRGFGLPYLEVWLQEPGGSRFIAGPAHDENGAFAPMRSSEGRHTLLGRPSLVRAIVLRRQARTIHDLRSADTRLFRRKETALELGLASVHAEPVVVAQRVVAALLVYGTQERPLADDERACLGVAAAQLAATLTRIADDAALRREREQARALLDHVADGIVACDADGTLTLINVAMELLHSGAATVGAGPEVWCTGRGLLLQDGVTPMPADQVPLGRALRGESFDDSQYVVDPPTGRRRIVRASGQPITDAGGAIRGAVVAVRDVTDRVATEAVTAAATERALRTYSLLLDDLADLARCVGESEDLAEVWAGVLDFAHHTLRADELVVVRTSGDGSLVPLYAAHSIPGRGSVAIELPEEAMLSPELRRAVRERSVVIEHGVARASLVAYPTTDDATVESLAAVPMVLEGAVLGGFEVRSRAHDTFDDSAAVALTMAANLAAIALDHDDLVEGERRARGGAETAARHFQQIFDASPAAVSISSLGDDRIIDANPAMESLLGYSHAELVGARGIDLGIWCDPEVRARVSASVRAGDAVRSVEVRLRAQDGVVRTCLVSADATELRGEATMLMLIVDVSERIVQQERLHNLARFRESLMTFIGETLDVGFDGPFYQRLLTSAVQATPNAQAGSLMVRAPGGDSYRFVAAVGYDLEGLRSVVFLDHEVSGALVEARAVATSELPTVHEHDERSQVLRRAGRLDDIRSTLTVPIYLEGARVAALSLDNFERSDAFDDEALQLAEAFATQVATLIKRRTLEHELEHMAYHDNLTGLPNRVLFRDRLQQAISRALRTDRRGAAIFLDLDNLKVTNDALGHAVGDALLVAVAQRLHASVRADDTVARIGGDEFTMVLPDVGDAAAAAGVADKILQSLRVPFVLDGNEVHVTASIGITLFPDDATDADSLIRHGDTAMYQAKGQGKDRYRFFTREMNLQLLERASLEAHLRKALERGELELHYQPRVSLADGRITSVEALARWPHPERGWISPATFIPVAEESGLIGAMGAHLLDLACRQAKAWEVAGTPSVVAVNLSARQLMERDLVRSVRDALERAELDPRLLELELTESTIMHNVGENIVKLGELRALGVSISIDDFGTAYSSLNYLKQLPATALKIDGSFVRDIDDAVDGPSHDTAIVRAIVALAAALEMT